MKLPITLRFAVERAGLCAALVLLAGCATPGRPVVEVTSPPTPRFGSGPIAAYDAYARVMFLPAIGHETDTLITTVYRPSVKSRVMVGEKRPAIVAQSKLQ